MSILNLEDAKRILGILSILNLEDAKRIFGIESEPMKRLCVFAAQDISNKDAVAIYRIEFSERGNLLSWENVPPTQELILMDPTTEEARVIRDAMKTMSINGRPIATDYDTLYKAVELVKDYFADHDNQDKYHYLNLAWWSGGERQAEQAKKIVGAIAYDKIKTMDDAARAIRDLDDKIRRWVC